MKPKAETGKAITIYLNEQDMAQVDQERQRDLRPGAVFTRAAWVKQAVLQQLAHRDLKPENPPAAQPAKASGKRRAA